MNVGSLFAGIGGFDLGFERAGMRTLWQVEQSDFRRAVLAHRFPHAERFSDVRGVGCHNLDPVDLICGGFPCQDISLAGKGAGIAGARSGLWTEFARIIGELRPRYVVVENVPALLARGGGGCLETFPRSGMTRSGTAYRLAPLAPLTAGTGSGSLPTPAATNYGSNQGGAAGRVGPVRHSLQSMARHNLWPTPHGMPKQGQSRRPGPSGNELGRAVNEAERQMLPTPRATDADKGGRGDLLAVVRTGKTSRRREWPTPTTADSRNSRNATANRSPGSRAHAGTTLSDTAHQAGGALNPTWVEWLMGFPLGWTDLPPSVMPSSRRSRSGSGGVSASTRKGG